MRELHAAVGKLVIIRISPIKELAIAMGSEADTPVGKLGREDLTLLLHHVHTKQTGAADALANAIYDELRAMAHGHLRKDFGANLAGATIQPTMLANDTLMNLIRQRQKYDNTGHFFAIASRVMMRVLMDYHRARKAKKRGGAAVHVSLEPDHHDRAIDDANDASDLDIEALDAALAKLESLDSRKAHVVRYRVLWGLTMPQISQNLCIALATAERDWTFAKTWLAKELKGSSAPER